MSQDTTAKLHKAVTELCAAIDRGEVVPGEAEMVALALIVKKEIPASLGHDLVCQLASRCEYGRKVLKEMAS